jgi:hypothetical protein
MVLNELSVLATMHPLGPRFRANTHYLKLVARLVLAFLELEAFFIDSQSSKCDNAAVMGWSLRAMSACEPSKFMLRTTAEHPSHLTQPTACSSIERI